MKAKLVITLLTLAAFELKLNSADLPAALPGFMDQAELAKWRADKAATQVTTSLEEESFSLLYTGKPYVAATGCYVFKYRIFNPAMSRWTTPDPSGFPDGANNCAYAPVATSQLDPSGLVTVNGGTNAEGPLITGAFPGTFTFAAYGGFSFAVADGSRFPNTDDSAFGGIVLSSSIASGAFGFNGSTHDISIRPSIRISIIPEVGLTYSTLGKFEGHDVVGTGIRYDISGENSRTLTVHLKVGYGFDATTVDGAGLGKAEGSISFGEATKTAVWGFGDFVFQE